MPHLSFDYSPTLDAKADLAELAATLRTAMERTGLFPLGGIRVRGHRADIALVADGGPHEFIDLSLRIGAGRNAAAKRAAVEMIYGAAEEWARLRLPGASLALSIELLEIDPDFSLKRMNTVRDHLKGA